MAGPVWRLDASRTSTCTVCFRQMQGVFVEGEVAGNELTPLRTVCRDCFERSPELVVSGEAGGRVAAPAYGRKP
jgi:hypothetical protein